MQRRPSLAPGQSKPVSSEDEDGGIGANIQVGGHPVTDFFGVPVEAVDDVQNERQLAIVPPSTEHAGHARKRLCDRFVFSNATVKILLTERSSRIKLRRVQLPQESIHFLREQLIEVDAIFRLREITLSAVDEQLDA